MLQRTFVELRGAVNTDMQTNQRSFQKYEDTVAKLQEGHARETRARETLAKELSEEVRDWLSTERSTRSDANEHMRADFIEALSKETRARMDADQAISEDLGSRVESLTQDAQSRDDAVENLEQAVLELRDAIDGIDTGGYRPGGPSPRSSY